MKRNFLQSSKPISIGIITVLALLASCNDEIDVETQTLASTETTSDDPFGCGYRLLSVTPYTIFSERIPLNSKDVELTNTNSLFSYRISEENNKFYIVPSFNGGSNKVECDVLTLKKKDGSAEKSILLTLTPKPMSTRAMVNTPDSIQAVLVQKMTKGFIPGKIAPDAQVSENLFNAESMFGINEIAYKNQTHFLTLETNEFSDYFYEKALNHNEIAQNNAKTAGFNLAVPLGGANIEVNVDYSTTTKNKTVRELETATYGWKCRKASGCMNMDYLSDYFGEQIDDNMRTYINDTVEAISKNEGETNKEQIRSDVVRALALQSIMDATAVNVLNNPESSSYKNYTNEKVADMRRLIGTYGMYIGTGCQLGGLAQTTLTKKTNSSEMTIEDAVKLTVEATADTKKESTTKDVTKQTNGDTNRKITDVLTKVPHTPSIKSAFGSNRSYSDIQNAMDIKYVTKAWGGDETKKDIDEWNPGKCCSKWKVISFAAQTANDTFDTVSSTDNKDFIPLWKLCLDPARREALRKLIEPDDNNQIGYFDYTVDAKKTLVIADVKLKIYKNMKDAKPVYDYDSRPNNKKMHLYIPMRCNAYYGLGTSAGSILDFAKWQLMGRYSEDNVWISNHMTALVAYEYVYDDDVKNNGDFTGITSLEMDGGTSGDQVRSGDDTFFIGDGHDNFCREGDHFIKLQYATDTTPIKERIKGVGFFYTGSNANSKDEQYKVFASSIGTDWNSNHSYTKAEYEYYWEKNNFINKDVKDNKLFFRAYIWHPVLPNSKILPAKRIYPCATTLDVTRNVDNDLKDAASMLVI